MNFNFHSHPTFPNCGKRSLRKFLRNLAQQKGKFSPRKSVDFCSENILEKNTIFHLTREIEVSLLLTFSSIGKISSLKSTLCDCPAHG